jgi:xanthine dehydrogenase accessory factor
MGSAIVHRLFRAKFRVVLCASEDSLYLMRGNSFAQAIFTGSFEVEGVPARKAVVTEATSMIDRDVVPVLTTESRSVLEVLNPDIVVDARFPSPKGEIAVGDASMVIGIGEGFVAGDHCDLTITTEPGHDMGKVTYRGKAPTPPAPSDEGAERVRITAEAPGAFMPLKRLGQSVAAGEPFAEVGGKPVSTEGSGLISGILREGIEVPAGAVLAEVDTRGIEDYCYTVSGVGRAVSGSVLEIAAAWVADMGGFPHPPQ